MSGTSASSPFLRKALFTLFFSTSLAVLAPSVASACSCAPFKNAHAAAEKAQLVFVGVADKLAAADEASKHTRVYSFTVERAWKGQPQKQLTIQTAASSATCGVPFELGSRYLVYARIDDQGQARTNLCSRTQLASTPQATEDIKIYEAAGSTIASSVNDPALPLEPAPPTEPTPPAQPTPAKASQTEAPTALADPHQGHGCTVETRRDTRSWLGFPLLLFFGIGAWKSQRRHRS